MLREAECFGKLEIGPSAANEPNACPQAFAKFMPTFLDILFSPAFLSMSHWEILILDG